MLLAAALTAAPGPDQHAHDTVKNPFTSEKDVAAGGRLYRSHCAVCHGIEGEGGRGVALTTGQFRHGSSDTDLYDTISTGIPGTEMPGIFFNGRQMWQLVGFVRSLSQGRAAEQTKGDPAKGREIYLATGCAGCHRILGAGGRMGPDLSDVGAVRSLGHLEASLLRPSESVLPQHWTVRAKTRDGSAVSGLRMNEDTFSVQLMDPGGQLKSFRKASLSELEIDRSSAMPAYEGRFNDEEFENLIAYLASLRLREGEE